MRALLFLLLALPAFAEPPRVVVDLGKVVGKPAARASGFLHGFTPDGVSPPDAMVRPLAIKLHRTRPSSTWTQAARMKALGITQQVVVSDGLGYGGPWPGDNDDWTTWETLCRDLVKKARSLGLTPQWDIWNEADHPFFWRRSKARWRETWRRGVKAIRAEDPKAIIVGPSLAKNRPGGARFADWLAYARKHDVVPDILSWHFTIDPVTEVETARALLAKLELTKRVKQLQINEYAWKSEQTPGKLAWYVVELERSGVDGAIHAIWGDEGKGNLDGLLADGKKGIPRGAWWVYQRYGGLSGELLAVTPTGKIAALACRRDARRVFVLLGHGADAGIETEPIELVLRNVPAALKGATVVVERYVHADGAPQAKPEVVSRKPLDGSPIRIPWASTDDAFGVSIEVPGK